MAGPKDNGRPPSEKGGETGRSDTEERSGKDDTPRETPSAKISDPRIPKAAPVAPAGVKRDGGVREGTPVRAVDETVRVDLPAALRDAETASDVRSTRSERRPAMASDALVRARSGEGEWRARPLGDEPVEGRVYVRTFRATGALGAVLLVLGVLVVLALLVAVFTFAVG
ncbi:MAG TPA: hypothetical protein VGL13_16630, partial [Polyangiaceae bacterium]